MSLFDCIQNAMDDTGSEGVNASKERGKVAQDMWKRLSDRYEADGHPRQTAEQLAADDVKEAFRRDYGEKRHVYLSVAAFQRKAQAHVVAAKAPDMVRRMEELDFKHRGMVRYANGRLREYLTKHHRDILGRVTKAAEQADIADELHGISTGKPEAKRLADSIRDTFEDLRLAFNEAGGLVEKLDNWGLPHVHNRLATMKAGKDGWFSQIDHRLDWTRINDPLTGRPMQADPITGLPPEAMRRSYLSEAWDNIVFGKEADDPVYGRPKGVATYRKHMDQRHLHFKSGKDWMEYNRDFGTGGIHASIMGHVHRMSRDIVLMREFGPNPKLGAEYEADLWKQRTKQKDGVGALDAIASDSAQALRMMSVMSGGNVPQDPMQQWTATFFSSARSLMGAAFLDRAIVSSLSDLNTMRLAAKSMGMNSTNLITRHLGMMQGLGRDDMLRAGWVADTMADAGTAVARFQAEFAPAEWAERVTQASMRLQGLSFWTDRARATAYFEMAGHLASQADRSFADLSPEMLSTMRKWKVSASDWDAFRDPANFFTAKNGATFLAPIHFRNVTKMAPEAADRLFFKMQGAAEEFLELAVPTRSLMAQGVVDPAAYNLPPGSIPYEVMKSGLAFKSFPLTFTINQIRQIKARGGITSKDGFLYGLDLVAGATLMGALSLQIGDLTMGRDPQDMTTADFWVRAAGKGGGFGILGDIVTTGQSSWGGGFGSYVSGPVPQLANDVWGITLGPAMTAAYQAATGQDVKVGLAKRLARFWKRYTPMGQTPIVGPAIDRLLWDQFQLLLDPESVDDMAKASKARQNRYGGGEYWMPGSPLPNRGPDFGAAIGR